jgi:hypothetical protein
MPAPLLPLLRRSRTWFSPLAGPGPAVTAHGVLVVELVLELVLVLVVELVLVLVVELVVSVAPSVVADRLVEHPRPRPCSWRQ